MNLELAGVRDWTLDDLISLVAEAKEEKRAVEWHLVDVIAWGMDALIEAGSGKHAAADTMGAAAGNRKHWALLCYTLSHTFPPDMRLPTLDLYHYRLALEADDPLAVLEMAADKQMSTKELRFWLDQQAGKQRPTVIRVRGTMDWTQGDIIITPDDYEHLELGEGLAGVPVKAELTTC